MALSDYLTSDEWDACYYVHYGRMGEGVVSLADSMHKTIDKLLEKGYKFSGLDEKGQKLQQVENGINAEKLVGAMMGTMQLSEAIEIFGKGRAFLKEHCPEMVDETDEEWEAQKKEALEEHPGDTTQGKSKP